MLSGEEVPMKPLVLELPTLMFVVGTRAALAAGLALLFAERVPLRRRRAIGVTLVMIGAATTIPALWTVRRSRSRIGSVVRQDDRLIGVSRFPRKGDEDDV
jgi:hypothetical protein